VTPEAFRDGKISPGLIYLLALAAGLTVANIYYNQPLLPAIARGLHASAISVSVLSVSTQLGYACGLLLLVPLGDALERRGLIVVFALATSVALLVVAFSPSLAFATVSSFIVGLVAITPQLIVPYAAALAPERRRGQVVGTIMGGLFIGILFSRTVGGFLGSHLGWQAVFCFGSGLTFFMALLLLVSLPRQEPEGRESYSQLLGSLLPLFLREPVLRRHALLGALGFGAFSAFWTTLAFYLAARPEHYGSQVVGLFGLVGIVGAAVAPFSGWLSDRFHARAVNGCSLLIVAVSFLIMIGADRSLFWLILGVFLMDAGVQTNQISNQTRIYALAADLRNRITSIYMFAYFLGGAIGSGVGAQAWMRWHWPGVCLTGTGMAALALVVLALPSPPAAGAASSLAPRVLEGIRPCQPPLASKSPGNSLR
jgi:predicted MFS family arabinose efflux permease